MVPGSIRRTLSSLSAILRRTPGYATLMYHRISDEPRDPWDLCVSPENFRAQLIWMRAQGFRFSTVSELAARIADGKDVRQRIAISFDDGYADNYLTAYPILAELDIPATFFIASDYIESQQPFWWDAVEQLFLDPAPLPERLEIHAREAALVLELRGTAYVAEQFRDWRWGEPAPTPRHAALVKTWHHLFQLAPAPRDAALDGLYALAGRTCESAAFRSVMTRAELRALASDPRMEIGAHTMRHPNLTMLDADAQGAEIWGSRRALQDITGRDIRGLAYPNGCYDSRTLRAVQAAGFTYACRNSRGPRDAGPLELSRNAVVNAQGGALSPDIYWHAGLRTRA